MPGAGARLDRHVADRHAALHRERLDRRARVLEHVAAAAGDAELADRGEHHVLRREPERQRRRRTRRASSSAAPAAASASRARARPRTCRCRTRARRTRRASRCGCRRRRSSCPAASARAPARSRARSPRGRCRSRRARTPNSSQFARERVELRSRERIGDRPVERRHVVVHRRDRQIGPPHAAAGERAAPRTPAGSSPRARGAGRRRGASGRRRASRDDVRVPDLPEERAGAHGCRSAGYEPKSRSSRVSARSSASAGRTASSKTWPSSTTSKR